jgi:asparagine synthase (glutamine-hydrolysing)
VLANFGMPAASSRKVWGLLCLELWHQIFHDRAAHYRRMLVEAPPSEPALVAGAAQ